MFKYPTIKRLLKLSTHILQILGKRPVKAFQNLINILLNIYIIPIFVACM